MARVAAGVGRGASSAAHAASVQDVMRVRGVGRGARAANVRYGPRVRELWRGAHGGARAAIVGAAHVTTGGAGCSQRLESSGADGSRNRRRGPRELW